MNKKEIELAQTVLRMGNVSLAEPLIKRAFATFELVKEKGEQTTLRDMAKLYATWDSNETNKKASDEEQ